jgi:hypothetical protein
MLGGKDLEMSIMILTNYISDIDSICETQNVKYQCMISFFTILGGYHYPNVQN